MKLKINALTNTYAKAKRTIAMLTADLEETSLRLRVLFCVCVCVWEREREREIMTTIRNLNERSQGLDFE